MTKNYLRTKKTLKPKIAEKLYIAGALKGFKCKFKWRLQTILFKNYCFRIEIKIGKQNKSFSDYVDNAKNISKNH